MARSELTITHVAGRANVRPSAIRYYESTGLLPPPVRVNGRRRYDEGVLERLAIIATAQRMGFTIAEIGTLLHGFDAETPAWTRWQTLARHKLPEIEALIAHAHGMKRLLEASLHCECLTLAECVAALQARHPREAILLR
jgi:MerR family transcriptional regulator, redox-sensitive transcriptional activator SoxR